jgi:hypothetical protein
MIKASGTPMGVRLDLQQSLWSPGDSKTSVLFASGLGGIAYKMRVDFLISGKRSRMNVR